MTEKRSEKGLNAVKKTNFSMYRIILTRAKKTERFAPRRGGGGGSLPGTRSSVVQCQNAVTFYFFK